MICRRWLQHRKISGKSYRSAYFNYSQSAGLPLYIIYYATARSLTYWDRVTHITVSKVNTIGSDDGLSPGPHQAIIWTNAGLVSIVTLGTNSIEIISEIQTFSLKKCISKCRMEFCLGLNVLTHHSVGTPNGVEDHCQQCSAWSHYPNQQLPLIGPLGVTNFIKILVEIQALSFKHMHLNVASGKWLTVFQVSNELKRCVRHVRKYILFLI